jgi:hypothetical protein
MNYRVTSDRMPWKSGQIVTDDDLEGCNIEALLDGGHLAKARNTKPEPATDTEENQ